MEPLKMNENEDLEKLFEGLIKPGVIEDEREIAPGILMRMRVLNFSEIVNAETMVEIRMDEVNAQRARSAAILSKAITRINGDVIERDGMTEVDLRVRRLALYNQIIKLPLIVIIKAYEFYLELAKKQDELYTNMAKTDATIENF